MIWSNSLKWIHFQILKSNYYPSINYTGFVFYTPSDERLGMSKPWTVTWPLLGHHIGTDSHSLDSWTVWGNHCTTTAALEVTTHLHSEQDGRHQTGHAWVSYYICWINVRLPYLPGHFIFWLRLGLSVSAERINAAHEVKCYCIYGKHTDPNKLSPGEQLSLDTRKRVFLKIIIKKELTDLSESWNYNLVYLTAFLHNSSQVMMEPHTVSCPAKRTLG